MSRRSRWVLELDSYDYAITHRQGKQHANADALSRHPSTDTQDKAVQCITVAQDAAQNSTVSKLHQKSQYDKNVVFHPHVPGNLVLGSCSPSLTALSGALPFRPPDPPRVPSGIVQPPFTTSAGETTPLLVSLTRLHQLKGSVPAAPSPVAQPVVSCSGRMIRQPLKYKDFVT
ncbi:hypothetical protein GOODEAATRI_022944 [Goodea atripinnis]|uniref:Uncharacterized protein n=1 Tax=Goodea atripinnis TaxID=208336 RepID=A0ABV0PR96_9TELE